MNFSILRSVTYKLQINPILVKFKRVRACLYIRCLYTISNTQNTIFSKTHSLKITNHCNHFYSLEFTLSGYWYSKLISRGLRSWVTKQL